MESRLLLTGSLLLVSVFAVLASSSVSSADDVLSLTAAPPQGEAFEFGELANLHLLIQNKSRNLIVVQQITPSSTGSDAVVLSTPVYGSVWKERDADAYIFNGIRQEATRLPFHGGLLLPGEKFVVTARHRPVARRENFEITYYIAGQAYDNIGESLQSLHVYVPAEPEQGAFPPPRYVPFTARRWKQITEACQSVGSLGPGNSPRAVLIPALDDESCSLTLSVVFRYEGTPFLIEEAMGVASRICTKKDNELKLAFCSALDGYVVFENDCSWVLASRDQVEKGDLLGLFPPILLRDIDSSEYVRVRIGDKQEGLGPDAKESSRKFWNSYPVYYGDGMYTRGEFLHLNQDSIDDFLRQAYAEGQALETRTYYFRARYYVLADPREVPAQPRARPDGEDTSAQP